MERFCTNCGQPLEEGALFCPECGERLPLPGEEAAPGGQAVPEVKEEIKEAPPQAPFTAPVPPAPAAPPIPEGPEVLTAYNKPLSTATYFWTLFLFGIPVIGLIVMLIMAFTAKNTNRRNLAQACLIGLLILLILLGLFMLVLVVSGKSFGVDISKFSFKSIWEGILTGIGFTK